jgi:hypothetical protein
MRYKDVKVGNLIRFNHKIALVIDIDDNTHISGAPPIYKLLIEDKIIWDYLITTDWDPINV